MPRGKFSSADELREQVLQRALEIILAIIPLTGREERKLLGWNEYHNPDVCQLFLLNELTELETWKSDGYAVKPHLGGDLNE